MCTNKELNAKIASLQEWEQLLAEAKAMTESIKDEIKAEMTFRNVETIETDRYIARWTPTTSSRFDTKKFKADHAEMYKSYTKEVASRRFSIA